MNRLGRLRGLRLQCAACFRNYFDLAHAKSRNSVLGIVGETRLVSKAFCHSRRALVKNMSNDSLESRIDPLSDVVEKTLRSFIDSSVFTPTDVANVTIDLEHNVYESLRRIPWLHESVRVAYMQLLLSDELNMRMKPLHEHPLFIELTARTQEAYKDFDALTLANTLRAFICLGVDGESQLMRNLFCAWRTMLPENCLSALRISSIVFKNYEFDFASGGQIVRRLNVLIDELEHKSASGKQVDATSAVHIASCILNVRHLSSADLMRRAARTFMNCVRLSPEMVSYHVIGMCAQVGRIIQKHDMALSSDLFSLVESAVNRLATKQATASTSDMAMIGKQLLVGASRSTEIAVKLAECVNAVLEERGESMSIRELAHCLVAMRRPEDGLTLARLESLLLRALHAHDVDIITLADICQCLVQLDCRNGPLLRAVQDLVTRKFDLCLKTFSIFAVVAKFIPLYGCTTHEQRLSFAPKVFQLLERPIETHTVTVAILAFYLLQDRVIMLPESFVERVASLLSECSIFNLHLLHNYVGTAQSRATGRAQAQLDAILAQIDEKLSARLSAELSIQEINYFLKRVAGFKKLHSRFFSVENISSLVDKYCKLTDNASVSDLNRIVVTLLKMRLYDSRLVEKLVQLLIRKGSLQEQFTVFKLCSVLGHHSAHGDALVASLLPLCDKYHDSKDFASLLLLLESFCRLQHFPELELSRVFTLDFIEKLDRSIRDKPWLKSFIHEMFMRLNRSVVLECPQLNVPWFHEDYCVRTFGSGRKAILSASLMHGEVRNTLADVLGGPSYYQTSALSPYYHHINFLCSVNTNNNRPVKVASTNNSAMLSEALQVAIVLMGENHYCLNSQSLLGYHVQTLRHLEIMNYKVVVVPHFEWYSMALAGDAAKRSYLAKRIFG